MSSVESPIVYEPFSEGSRDFDVYQQLLRHPGLYQSPSGIYVASRYADVREVFKRPKLFSSSPAQAEFVGMATDADQAAADEARARMEKLTEGLPVSAEELMTSRMIAAADPPRHTHLRGVVNRAFLPRRMDAWRGYIQERVDELTDGLDGSEPFDVISRVAVPLPVGVISKILSVTPGDEHKIKEWTDGIIGGAQGPDRGTPAAAERIFKSFREFVEYFSPIIEDRKVNPREDDVISAVVHTQQREAATLSAADVLLFLLVVMSAGNETTTNVISNAVVALLEHPEQLELVVQDPTLIPQVVEETLRYRGPVQFLFREALEETEISGTRIPKGAMVAVVMGAANHDPEVFEDPLKFDVRRENASAHVGFGHGIHFCVGAALARLEITTALTALLPILPRVKLASPPVPVPSMMIMGYGQVNLAPR